MDLRLKRSVTCGGLFGLGLVFTASLAVHAEDIAKHTDEVEGEAVFVSKTELMKQPAFEFPGALKVWALPPEKPADTESLLIEVTGTVPLHFHEGVHRHIVLSGKIKMTVGKKDYKMGPGDFLYVPSKVRHKGVKVGPGPCLLYTVDTGVDPSKIVWLEAAPKEKEAPATGKDDGKTEPEKKK